MDLITLGGRYGNNHNYCSQPARLETGHMSNLVEEDTLECDQVALKAREAGIPSSPGNLERLRVQKEKKQRQNNYIVLKQSQHAHIPQAEPVQGIEDKQTPLPTPNISRIPSVIVNESPNLSPRQTTVSILSSPESVNGNSESLQTSPPRSSTVSDQRRGDSLSNTITYTSSATSNTPSTNESQSIRKRAVHKSPTASSTSQVSPNAVLQPSRSYSIVIIDQKYYVSTDMPIPEESMNLWRGEIKERLEDALCRESRATYDSEASLALEFHMVGTNNKNLKPSIMITCCSSKMKKNIKKCLGNLKWLDDSGLRYFIWVDKTFGQRTVPTNEFYIEHPLVEARLAPMFDTLCGVSAQIRDASSVNDEGGESAPIRFTLGGIVCTDWGPACLTAGHVFLPSIPENEAMADTASLGDEGSDSGGSDFGWDDDSSPSESFDNSSNEPILYPKPTPCAPLSKIPFRPFLHRGLISDVESPHVTRSVLGDVRRPGNPDWAVFLLQKDSEFVVPNSIRLPGENSPSLIDKIVPREDLDSGSVWIAAGSGLQRGSLNANLASVLLQDTFRNVYQIILERSLAHGDSGSWVIRNSRVCGCIIAGRDSLPWAYMVSIEEVFDNMSIGHATALYTHEEIQRRRIFNEKEAHDNSANTSDHSKLDLSCLLKSSPGLGSGTHNINILNGDIEKPSSPHEFKHESEEHRDESLFDVKAFRDLGRNGSLHVNPYPSKAHKAIFIVALVLSIFR